MKWEALKRLNTPGAKFGLLAAAVVLVLGLVISGSMAYLTESSGGTVNKFEPAAAACENIGTNGLIQIHVPETADNGTLAVDAYVRVTVVVNWKDAAGNLVAKFDELPDLPTTDLGEGWVYSVTDGYYYYTKVVEPGALTDAASMTTPLFKQAISAASEGYSLSVTVITDAIQANGYDEQDQPVVLGVWDAVESVGADGTLTIKPAADAAN